MLQEYYKLKTLFDERMTNMKKEISKGKSKKEKRKKYLELKPKCISCNTPSKIGTIFSVQFVPSNEKTDDYRLFKIKCGNLSHPCSLHIEFQVDSVQPLDELLVSTNQELITEKNQIIELKNKLLFGLIERHDALKLFDEESEFIATISHLYNYYLSKWTEVVNNPEKKEELNSSIQLAYQKISEIKEYMSKMTTDHDETYATDVARISCTELEPLMNKIRQLKYSENAVIDLHLIQKPHTIRDLEFQEGEIRVVADTMDGMIISSKKKRERTKEKALSKPKPLTHKPKPMSVSSDTDSEDEKETDGDEDEEEAEADDDNTENAMEDDRYSGGGLTIVIKDPYTVSAIPEDPIVGQGESGIDWKSDEYKDLWTQLPVKLKDIFKLHLAWLKEFMHQNVVAKKNNPSYVYKITAPPSLRLPPLLLEDGTYDMNVDIYNKTFNNLDPETQKGYLALYQEDPITRMRTYERLEQALNSLVEKEVQFYVNMAR